MCHFFLGKYFICTSLVNCDSKKNKSRLCKQTLQDSKDLINYETILELLMQIVLRNSHIPLMLSLLCPVTIWKQAGFQIYTIYFTLEYMQIYY